MLTFSVPVLARHGAASRRWTSSLSVWPLSSLICSNITKMRCGLSILLLNHSNVHARWTAQDEQRLNANSVCKRSLQICSRTDLQAGCFSLQRHCATMQQTSSHPRAIKMWVTTQIRAGRRACLLQAEAQYWRSSKNRCRAHAEGRGLTAIQ